MLNVDALY